jgi:hypothetical protein
MTGITARVERADAGRCVASTGRILLMMKCYSPSDEICQEVSDLNLGSNGLPELLAADRVVLVAMLAPVLDRYLTQPVGVGPGDP